MTVKEFAEQNAGAICYTYNDLGQKVYGILVGYDVNDENLKLSESHGSFVGEFDDYKELGYMLIEKTGLPARFVTDLKEGKYRVWIDYCCINP